MTLGAFASTFLQENNSQTALCHFLNRKRRRKMSFRGKRIPYTPFIFATRAAIYRSLRTLPGPKSQKKSQKRSFLGVRRKVPKNTRKSLKIPKKLRKSVFLDFSGYFLRLFCGPPKRPFLRLFAISGPEGPETPVNGGSGRDFI